MVVVIAVHPLTSEHMGSDEVIERPTNSSTGTCDRGRLLEPGVHTTYDEPFCQSLKAAPVDAQVMQLIL
jgi:hypothetical protein